MDDTELAALGVSKHLIHRATVINLRDGGSGECCGLWICMPVR